MVPLGAAPFSPDNAAQAGILPPRCSSSASLARPGSSLRYSASDTGVPWRIRMETKRQRRPRLKLALEMEALVHGSDQSASTSPASTSKEDRMRCRAMRTRQDWVGGWVQSNDTLVRGLPILVGGASLLAVLLNRAVSGIAAVSDASSSQSRADILTLALSVTDILAGLVWLSIRPKSISPVVPRGVECKRVDADVSSSALHEVLWTWDSLTAATCRKSLVVMYGGNCILQIGVAAVSPQDGSAVNVDVQKFTQGSLYTSAMQSKKQSYLANLALYPGRTELPFLPANTQALILQPIGDKGIAVIGGDTIRGFTNLDQAWIAMIADKLDATLSKS